MSTPLRNLRGFTGLLDRLIPSSARSLQTKATTRPIPPPTDQISTPKDFLSAIGRSSEKKLSFDTWEALWKVDRYDMKKAGVSVQDRRYILWCMEKFRTGLAVKLFAYEPKPKKMIRGWGPKVVQGKRIRSRRHR